MATSEPLTFEQALEVHRSGDLARAEVLYRSLLQQEPSALVAANLGALLRQRGRLGEAEKLYRWALQHTDPDPLLLANACNLFRSLGYIEETIDLLRQGLRQFVGHPALRQGLALSLHHQGNLAAAISLLEPLVQEYPKIKDLYLELGTCLAKQGNLCEGLSWFERGAEIFPDEIRFLANRISLLVDLGRLNEAERLLPQQRPLHPTLLATEAALLMTNQKLEEALERFKYLIEVEPGNANHWLNLAACQKGLKQMVAPLHSLQRAVALAPQRLDLQQGLASMLVDHGRGEEALPLLLAACDAPDHRDVHQYNLQFAASAARLLPAQELAKRAQAWEERRQLSARPLWRDRIKTKQSNRVLRVGYLSPDFANHPVGRFIEPIFEHHRRDQFQVVALSSGPHHDSLTERLRRHSDEWHDIRFGEDLAVARQLANLELDIIIDLAGYTGNQRLRLLTARPAPIQLSYLGYFASTHLRCIDGWIGDAFLFPRDLEQESGGQALHRLPRCYMAYRPKSVDITDRLSQDPRFRFGSFNHSRKLSKACMELWATVLRAIPDSMLVLKSQSFVERAEIDRIAQQFSSLGVNTNRLELLSWAPNSLEHYQLYGRIDVALDPIPYGGATTTCDALWMGVPVLALAGDGMVGRLSTSVLAGANLSSAIAYSSEHYVQLARLFASRGPRSALDRLRLRQHVQCSPLFDELGLVASLESLYKSLYGQI